MFLLYYLHADQIDSSRLGGHQIRKATNMGFLTSGQVQAATSVTDLQTDVSAATCHADEEAEKKVVNDGLELAEGLGDLTDTLVQSATSVEDLADDTQATYDDRSFSPTVLD